MKLCVNESDDSNITYIKIYETGQVYCKEDEGYDAQVFLPSYSLKLNLIEGLWKWLKDSVINNTFYSTVKEIKSAVREFINNINLSSQKVIDRLCIRP